MLRLCKVSVLIVVVYLWVGPGLSADNLAILNMVRLFVASVSNPCVDMGDFNLTRAELDSAGWPGQVGLVGLRTRDDSTVLSLGGRSVDHVFVSPRFAACCGQVRHNTA